MLHEWLAKGLKKPGKTQTELANRLGVDQSAVSKMVSGRRKISAPEMLKVAKYLDEPIPTVEKNTHSKGYGPVLKRGRIAAGVWRESAATQEEPEPTPIPRDPRYPHVEQYSLEVEGESVNKVAQNGWMVVCVPYWDARREMRPGDLVHVERKNAAGQHEFTLKRLQMGNGGLELRSESTHPDYQKPVQVANYDGYTVEIIGLVIGIYNPNP